MKNMFYSKFVFFKSTPGENSYAESASQKAKTYMEKFDDKIKNNFGTFIGKFIREKQGNDFNGKPLYKGSPSEQMARYLVDLFDSIGNEFEVDAPEGGKTAAQILEEINKAKIPVNLIAMLALRYKGIKGRDKDNFAEKIRFFAAKLTKSDNVLAHIAYDTESREVAKTIVENKACLPYIIKILLSSKDKYVRMEAKKSRFASRYEKTN